ncbi:hypothetical protein L6452_37605 [Arctium lappa]|uniref:Uncharacterized protein n=1 Tax=Arctium lappa TaxID=4217 RepID=A0ACB8Y2P1_ARCLA|nr:hypothetical protein L6452_37605 [Arctium lappa]
MLLNKISTASSKLILLRVLMLLKNNTAYVITNSHGRMIAGWTKDYGKLGDNDRRYAEDILFINQPQGIDPNSREVQFVLKELVLQD